MNNNVITELVRGRKKEQLLAVLSHIDKNVKTLLARAHPGGIKSSYSLIKKNANE